MAGPESGDLKQISCAVSCHKSTSPKVLINTNNNIG
jgi:hypothetical protein